MAKRKKDSAIARLALMLALVTTPMAANIIVSVSTLAQSATDAPTFSLPQTVESGTKVRIDGSSSLSTINQSVKQGFEKQFSGTQVEVAANGADAALKALLENKIDVAAIGRGLTPEEKAQGLEQVRLHREKIAIIVGKENPFKGNLTDRQFARIFRGRIKDWSEVGGTKGKIRVIDRPAISDVRESLSSYPVFKAAKFATGANATQISDDNTAEIAKQLGKDGISYALANEVSKLPDVRVLRLHQALPNDPKYPFSQPLVYVYKKNPSPAVASFLGFTLASPGKKAIEEARVTQANAIAANSGLQSSFLAPNPTPNTEATAAATTTPNAESTPAATVTPNATSAPIEQPVSSATANNPIAQGKIPFWWFLLPLAMIGGLLTWLLRSSPSDAGETGKTPESPADTPVLTDNTGVTPVVNESPTHTPTDLAAEEIPTNSDLSENQAPAVSNTGDNNTLIGDAAMAGTGAAVWSTIANKNSDNSQIEETANSDNSAGITPYELDESPWDIEAPAAVVNTSYPAMPDSLVAPNVEPPLVEVSAPTVAKSPQTELNWLEEITSPQSTAPATEFPTTTSADNADISDIEVSEDVAAEELLTELNWLEELTATESTTPVESEETAELSATASGEITAGTAWPTAEVTTSLPELPDIPEEALNIVADEAEPTDDETTFNIPEKREDFPQVDAADFAGGAALVGAGIGAWAIHGIQDNAESETPAPNHRNAADKVDSLDAEDESWIILTPRDSQSADVSWHIFETRKQTLRDAGIYPLSLRLYDATDLDLSYQSPRLVQQYECDEVTEERYVAIPTSDRDYIAEIGYLKDGDRWVNIASSSIVRVFSPIPLDTTPETILPTGHEAFKLVNNVEEESRIVLTPRDYQRADVSWQISQTHSQALQEAKISQLSLRLYDATGFDLSYQTPHLVQQYECDQLTGESYVSIPVSDRDYIAEIGYTTDGDRWVNVASSPIVRVFSPIPPDTAVANTPITEAVAAFSLLNGNNANQEQEQQSNIVLTSRTPKWAYVYWNISATHKQTLQDVGISQLALRLYDVTDVDLSYQNPQLIQQYECEEATHDRYVAIPTSDRDYMTEIGYITDGDRWHTIARSLTVRVFSRPRQDFWFVADTELIIHGATEPGATVTIAGNPVTLKSDGTFHLRIPFSDSLIDYLMTATATNGEQTKIIHKKFFQETPES